MSQGHEIRCDTETQRQREDQDAIVIGTKDGPVRQGIHDDDVSSTSSLNGTTIRQMGSRLPKTYGDLIAKFTVAVKRDRKNGF